MGNPVTTKSPGICFAFPNVCRTPPFGVPIPYPSIGQLSGATGIAASVKAGRNEVVTMSSTITSTLGDSAGSMGGVISGSFGGKVQFATASGSVFAEGAAVVRMFDTTKQNNGNAQGIVLGGFPTVLVGD